MPPNDAKDIDPDAVPNPNVPPLDDASKENPRTTQDDTRDTTLEMPETTDKDLTEDFPDAEDDRSGRRDPNILEKEEMEDRN